MHVADRQVFRHRVLFCVLPHDLAQLHDELRRWFDGTPDVEVVVERRGAGERRSSGGAGAPDGVERRRGDRRSAAGVVTTAAAVDIDLPRSALTHAHRITCAWRMLPVRFQDADREADALFVAALHGDLQARDELRLRQYREVHDALAPLVPRRRLLEATDRVFDVAFESAAGTSRRAAIAHARARVLGA